MLCNKPSFEARSLSLYKPNSEEDAVSSRGLHVDQCKPLDTQKVQCEVVGTFTQADRDVQAKVRTKAFGKLFCVHKSRPQSADANV